MITRHWPRDVLTRSATGIHLECQSIRPTNYDLNMLGGSGTRLLYNVFGPRLQSLNRDPSAVGKCLITKPSRRVLLHRSCKISSCSVLVADSGNHPVALTYVLSLFEG